MFVCKTRQAPQLRQRQQGEHANVVNGGLSETWWTNIPPTIKFKKRPHEGAFEALSIQAKAKKSPWRSALADEKPLRDVEFGISLHLHHVRSLFQR